MRIQVLTAEIGGDDSGFQQAAKRSARTAEQTAKQMEAANARAARQAAADWGWWHKATVAASRATYQEIQKASRDAEAASKRAAQEKARAEREAARVSEQAWRDAQRRMTQELRKAESDRKAALAKARSDVRSAFGNLGQDLSLGVSVPVGLFGKAALDAAVDLDSLKKGLQSVSGSAEEAERQFIRLRDLAKAPGIGLREAIQGSTRLQAAGFKPEEAERMLREVANAVALVGGGRQELDRITVNLMQIAGAGKLTGDELREIGMLIPQTRKILQETFNTSDTKELADMGVTGRQALDAIVDGYSRLERAQASAKTQFENFSTTSFEALAKIGAAILPPAAKIAEELAPAITKAADAFAALSPEMKDFIIKLGLVAIATGPVIAGISKVVSVAQGLKGLGTLLAAGRTATAAGGAVAGSAGIAGGLAGGAVVAGSVASGFLQSGAGRLANLGRGTPFEGLINVVGGASALLSGPVGFAAYMAARRSGTPQARAAATVTPKAATQAHTPTPLSPFVAQANPKDALDAADALFATRIAQANAILARSPEETRAQAEAERLIPLLRARQAEIQKRGAAMERASEEYQELAAETWELEEQIATLQNAAGKERADNIEKARKETEEAARKAKETQERDLKNLFAARDAYFDSLMTQARMMAGNATSRMSAEASEHHVIPVLAKRYAELEARARLLLPQVRTSTEAQAEFYRLQSEATGLQLEAADLRRATAQEYEENLDRALKLEQDAAEKQRQANEKAKRAAEERFRDLQERQRDAQSLAGAQVALAEAQLRTLEAAGARIDPRRRAAAMEGGLLRQFLAEARPVTGESALDAAQRRTALEGTTARLLEGVGARGGNRALALQQLNAVAMQAAREPVLAGAGGATVVNQFNGVFKAFSGDPEFQADIDRAVDRALERRQRVRGR